MTTLAATPLAWYRPYRGFHSFTEFAIVVGIVLVVWIVRAVTGPDGTAQPGTSFRRFHR